MADEEEPAERLPSLTRAQKDELEAACEAARAASQHAKELAERLCPFKIGDRICIWGETRLYMQIEAIDVSGVGGMIRLEGHELTKTGKISRKVARRHVNLFHLPTAEEAHG